MKLILPDPVGQNSTLDSGGNFNPPSGGGENCGCTPAPNGDNFEYGPFYRKDIPENIMKMLSNSELWGKSRRGGYWPEAQAYVGHLPDSVTTGIEFYTNVAPTSYGRIMDKDAVGCEANYNDPKPGICFDSNTDPNDFLARIKIRITKFRI